jgi:low temperature requirement protein LtrA
MNLIDRAISLVTLASLFVLGPAFGRAILFRWERRQTWSQSKQHMALGLSTMIALTGLLLVYGVVWKMSPRTVAWYSWIATDLPISGNVDVTGSVSAEISEPLHVKVDQ